MKGTNRQKQVHRQTHRQGTGQMNYCTFLVPKSDAVPKPGVNWFKTNHRYKVPSRLYIKDDIFNNDDNNNIIINNTT